MKLNRIVPLYNWYIILDPKKDTLNTVLSLCHLHDPIVGICFLKTYHALKSLYLYIL